MTEHEEQVVVFEWAKLHCHVWPALKWIYAIPNQRKQKVSGYVYMKKEGLKAGIPDICLPISKKGYSSLYIELKTQKGKATEKQMQAIQGLNSLGNLAIICRGSDEAIKTLKWYLSDKK